MEKLYRPLGKTGFNISPVVYGGIVSMKVGQENSDENVKWAIDQGINYFDVAPAYGDAQEKLGNSLVPYRNKIYLACKTQKRTRKEAEVEFKESLRLLKTDYFDVYQMHELSRLDELETAFGPGGVMELMKDLKEKGLVKKLGITCHSEKVALKALELYNFDTVLFPINWHMNLKYGMGNQLIKVAKEKGIGILGMKSMIERSWDLDNQDRDKDVHNKYNKSWCKPFDTDTDQKLLLAAIKYAFSLGVDTIVPPGNFDHFNFGVKNIEYILKNPLSEDELNLLKTHLKEVENLPLFDIETGQMLNRWQNV